MTSSGTKRITVRCEKASYLTVFLLNIQFVFVIKRPKIQYFPYAFIQAQSAQSAYRHMFNLP